MKFNQILFGLLVVFIFSSCATSKLAEEGNAAYQTGDYIAALNAWEQVISDKESRGQTADTSIYFKAGKAAMELGNTAKARTYFEKAEDMQYEDPAMYASLAHIYKGIDNLSLEIEALENYHEKFPNGKVADTINVRLFQTYVESENWQKAVNLWPEIEEKAASDADLLTGYLIVNEQLENDNKCDQLAQQILKLDPDNIEALEWQAYKFYWKAENLYVSQMKAYQKNRTNRQYKKLLKAWDKIWPDFRKARSYFLKLYKLDPKPKYAKYLAGIYTRMKKEQKAAYWERRAN